MKYFIREEENGFAVKRQGNKRATEIELTENQADKLAHRLAKRDGNPHVKWAGLDGKFEPCPCRVCKASRN